MSSTAARLLLPISIVLGGCAGERHGVKVDAARYEEGLRQGRWDFPDRMT